MELAIQTHDLTVRYQGAVGIDAVTLEVARGEVFGFLGKNGAGKTTTIRVLLDLLRPDRGDAKVLGIDVRAGGGELRRRIGFLPGDLALLGTLTGDATLALFTDLQGRPPVRRDELLGRLGFPRHALARKVKSYSTGMRQMIGITLAMQHEPELLILDEPTTGLDPLVRDSFLALVRDCRTRGQTVFLSSHVLDEVERCADRVGIIHDGRLRRVGGVAELRLGSARVVTLTFEDGRIETFESHDEPAALLATIDALRRQHGDTLRDLEVRSLGLDSIFRHVVKEASA